MATEQRNSDDDSDSNEENKPICIDPNQRFLKQIIPLKENGKISKIHAIRYFSTSNEKFWVTFYKGRFHHTCILNLENGILQGYKTKFETIPMSFVSHSNEVYFCDSRRSVWQIEHNIETKVINLKEESKNFIEALVIYVDTNGNLFTAPEPPDHSTFKIFCYGNEDNLWKFKFQTQSHSSRYVKFFLINFLGFLVC
eukprot:TRINITY_DN1642_c0_g1_i2.p1 TRINITY_DN1642_c0_g1~~TRINITY_DN1642_c0_g1_i2.p1  ORF type:complete len:197 (-),score=30.45 TRINITY_DN1642_c0_g1_i2:620-1210(-)